MQGEVRPETLVAYRKPHIYNLRALLVPTWPRAEITCDLTVADDHAKFKNYQAEMALKRCRKTEKKSGNKNKDRLLPSRLTIQRLSAQVKGSSQKYARMGPLKRVEVADEDLSKQPSIDIVRRACITGFKMDGFYCDLLETERGLSIESLDEVKNLNGTNFVRFIYKVPSGSHLVQLEFNEESDDDEISTRADQIRASVSSVNRLPPAKPMGPNLKKAKVKHHSVSSGCSSTEGPISYPASMSVTSMLRLGTVVKPPMREEMFLKVEQFDVTNGWSMARNVRFSVEVNSFAEGGFRKAHKCESEDQNFPGIWVLKKYSDKALDDMGSLGVEEEDHACKQVQMHTLAQNIANQMTKYVDKEYGQAFSYDNIFLGKIKSLENTNQGFVTIEKYIEGSFTKYINNNGNVTANKNDVITQKAETLVHYSYQMSKGQFLLVDIQGTGYKLYDPEIASTVHTEGGNPSMINFCIGNLSTQAIDVFFENHICNIYCKKLGLKEDKPKYHI